MLHELQGRVASVAIYVGEMSHKLPLTDEAWTRGWLERLARTAAEMRTILETVRLILDGRPPELAQIDVSGLCSEIFRIRIEEHPSWMNTTFSAEDGIEVIGDPREIRIVLENLLSNALKFSTASSAPSVCVSSTTLSERTVVQVTDNGIGVAPEDTELMFAPFTRLTGEYAGTGLGLTVAKLIVERHGGRIWAQGERGLRTTISFFV